VRRGACHGHKARADHRDDPGRAAASALARLHHHAGLRGLEGALPRPAAYAGRRLCGGGRIAMTIPQTSAEVVAANTVSNKTVATWTADAATGPAPAKPARHLPVQKDWPTWAIVSLQIGILVGIIALWEIGAVTGFIDKF